MWKKFRIMERLPRAYLAVGAVLTMVLWLLRPAAGDGLSGYTALLFWGVHVAVILPLLYCAQNLIGRISLFDKVPPITVTVIAGMLGSAAFTPFAIGLDALFAAPNDEGETGPIWSFWLGEFASFVFPVSLIWVLVNARALSKLSVPHLSEDDENLPIADIELSEDEKEFWNRMPKALGKDIVAVSAELHYLRVYTSEGDTLILFGFGRSLGVLARFEGMKIHRSHWIALSHVVDTIRISGTFRCKLTNGTELPVSRSNSKLLRDRLEKRDFLDLKNMS